MGDRILPVSPSIPDRPVRDRYPEVDERFKKKRQKGHEEPEPKQDSYVHESDVTESEGGVDRYV